MADLRPFHSGIEAARQRMPCHDPRGAFHSLLSSEGYNVDNIRLDELTRIDSPNDKKRGRKSGWYVYREIADEEGAVIGLANYGCWIEGNHCTWQSKQDHVMSTQERLKFHSAREAMRAAHEAEKRRQNIEAAERAFKIWSESKEITEHPYLMRKGVDLSPGLKAIDDGRLCIPIVRENEIISLQFIEGNGEKRFLRGSTTTGGYFKIEGDNSKIFIAEGYATGKSLNMATGNTAYIAFSCHNMTETALSAKAQNPDAAFIVAGDIGNGSKDAERAAEAIGGECVFPIDTNCKDFNDYHQAHGIEALRSCFITKGVELYEKKSAGNTSNVRDYNPTGFLLDVYNYYNATSGNVQHGFAMQTALAVASVVCGRAYKTDYNNYTSLYFMCVGKTGTGKEHPKTVIENILYSADMGQLVAGDGYTSAGAVFTALLDKPRHVTIIDELGRYLEAGRGDGAKGTHNQREANTKIMEAFGRCHSVMRPAVYSTMTQTKEVAEKMKSRIIHNPSVTLIGMSTPETLFKSLDMGAIKDGFVNRFIISVSDAERTIRRHKAPIQVPIRIIDWIERISARYAKAHSSAEPSEAVTLEFTDEAYALQDEFQQYCIDKANTLDKFGIAELTGRSNEIAMRIALICALSESPEAKIIEARHINWASEYVKMHLEDTISRLKISISSSSYENDKKEILAAIRERGEDGILWSQMQKELPFSKHKAKDLKEILTALKDADLAIDEPFRHTNGKGRPTVRWVALK